MVTENRPSACSIVAAEAFCKEVDARVIAQLGNAVQDALGALQTPVISGGNTVAANTTVNGITPPDKGAQIS